MADFNVVTCTSLHTEFCQEVLQVWLAIICR